MKFGLPKSDIFGAIASTMCMVHCIVTPFLFVIQTCSVSCCEVTPNWWSSLDYFFLVISLIAVYQSTRTTSVRFIKPALWGSWLTLFFVIINEKIGLITLPEAAVYVAAIILTLIHLYNLKFCKCKSDNCCASNE